MEEIVVDIYPESPMAGFALIDPYYQKQPAKRNHYPLIGNVNMKLKDDHRRLSFRCTASRMLLMTTGLVSLPGRVTYPASEQVLKCWN